MNLLREKTTQRIYRAEAAAEKLRQALINLYTGPCGAAGMLLSEMKEGQSAIITRVGGSGALRRRLLEMGLLKGTSIYVEKYAPLRDPLELIVKGYHVSLRVEEAAQITVDQTAGEVS